MYLDIEALRFQEGFRRLVSLTPRQETPTGMLFECDEGFLQAYFFAPRIFRLRLEKQVLPDYGLLVAQEQPLLVTKEQHEDAFSLAGEGVRVLLQANPLRLTLYHNEQVVLESATDRAITGDLRLAPFAFGGDAWLISLALKSHEALFGLGEKFGPLNRRGQQVISWNRDAGGVNAEISYKNVPFLWSSEGWALFIHTPASVTHGVGYSPWSHRAYLAKIEEPNLDLFFIVGDTPAQILERYTWLTGRSPLPPLWSFGVWMSRAYYKTAEEALQVARELRHRRLPCDVLTLDGRAWHKPETRFDFSWDPDRYPNPAEFIAQLRALHFRLCLWEYPYLSIRNPLFEELSRKDYFLRTPQGEPYIHRWLPPPLDSLIPHLQPSAIVDFTNPQAYTWFCEAHRPLFEMGVSVMKTDYGEAVPPEVVANNGDCGRRLHNVYALLYNRCAYEAAQRYGREGAIVWGRAGWTGSQRYPLQWGGDPQGDWEGLAASLRGALSWGLSGVPFYAHDIGGFYGLNPGEFPAAGLPESELYVRWAQVGILSSHTRFHGTSLREPWVFGKQVEALLRRWLELRYRLIPYLQACALEAHQKGLPVLRAMPLAFPEDRPAWQFDTQYMLGPALLVIPVLQAGGRAAFYLPPGEWYDLWSGERLVGPRYLEQHVTLDRLPLFGRAGETLLLGPIVQYTDELTPDVPVNSVVFGRDDFRLVL